METPIALGATLLATESQQANGFCQSCQIWARICGHCQNTFAETAQQGNGKGKKGIAQNAKAGLWPVKGLAAPESNPWLADIWRLRRLLKPGMKYGYFEGGQFPKIGKLQNPLIAYLEMVRRRYAGYNKSKLEAATALHLRCAGYLRKDVEEEMQRHTLPAHQHDISPKIGYLQRILDYAFVAQGDICVLGQRLDQTEVEKLNKEAEIIDYYSQRSNQSHHEEVGQLPRQRIK